MAEQQTHFSISLVLSAVYALAGLFVFDVSHELVVLAAVIVTVAGILPNVDSGKGPPSREFAGLLGAISPLLAFEFFPVLRVGGIARIVLVIVCSYMLTRIVVSRAIQSLTTHRGVLHSIPAAIIAGELTYLLFWDVFWYDRIYLASAALLGFLSHLILDAYTNIDFMGKAMGNEVKKPAVLKLGGATLGSTLALYSCVLFLGYFVAIDFEPSLKNYSPFAKHSTR